MGFRGGRVAAGVVVLTHHFRGKLPIPVTTFQSDRVDYDITRSANLFHREQLSALDILRRRQCWSRFCAEELPRNCCITVSMNASPAPALEVVETQFIFRLPEAAFRCMLESSPLA